MNRKELEFEIQEMLDGTLDANRVAALEEELKRDDQARSVYLSYARLQGSLEMALEGRRSIESLGIGIEDKVVPFRKRKWVELSLAAAVMLSLFSGALLWFRTEPESESRHAFQATPGADYSITHSKNENGISGDFLRTGSRLELRSGKFECWIEEGVHMIVEGPADLTVKGEKEVFLTKGNAWFNVAKGAEGFAVVTPEAKIVDLGTEFGVAANLVGEDQAYVFAGEVKITNRKKSSEPLLLKAGESCSVRTDGKFGKATDEVRETFVNMAREATMSPPRNLRNSIANRSVLAGLPCTVVEEVFTEASSNEQADDYLQIHRDEIRFTASRDFLFGNPGLLTNAPDTRGAQKGGAPAPDGVQDTRWDYVFNSGLLGKGFSLTDITVHGALPEPVGYGFSRADLQFAIWYSTVEEPELFRTLLANDSYVIRESKRGEGVRVHVVMDSPLDGVNTLRFQINSSPSRESYSSVYSEIDVNGYPTK